MLAPTVPVQSDASAVYSVRMMRRLRLGGRLFVVGQVVDISGATALRMAAELVKQRAARPADAATALDVELLHELQREDHPPMTPTPRSPQWRT